MQAWLPVLLVWFVSLFTSTLTVITCIYRFLDRGKYRWRNIHKHLSPWILLALLTAAFMVGNVWVIASSRETRVQRMTEYAGLIIGLFVALFFIICIVTVVLWTRYQKRRTARQAKDSQQTITKSTCVEQNCESVVTSFENYEQSHEISSCQEIDNIAFDEMTASYKQTFPLNDEILILRNLSNPDEEFCINLSKSNVPVVKRKSTASIEDLFKESILPKPQIHHIEDRRITVDVEC